LNANGTLEKPSGSRRAILKCSQKLARLQMQLNRLEHKGKKMANDERKARTRTLIQVGGLMDVAKLLDDFDIELGEDLQIDETKNDNAAMLLGFLNEAKKQIS
jgi:hypothetical protein